ncbi:MAG: metallophosphoesterase, partial [Pseudomonadota bacterium]
ARWIVLLRVCRLAQQIVLPRSCGLAQQIAVRPLRSLVLLYLLGAASLVAHAGISDWQGVERIIAIADVHGDYDNYITVLQQAGVVDKRGRWSAGATHFVQLGDVPDRGPDTAKIIEHLMKLEVQANKSGGKVHVLIGNHEVMNMIGDLRYVHPGEYEALTSRKSDRLREDYYAQLVDFLIAQEPDVVIDPAFREQWLTAHPLGYVEHRQHWHPQGPFGAWVRSHNTVVRINRNLFVHGGLSPDYIDWSLQRINETVRTELATPAAAALPVIEDEDGPLWYRGLSLGEELPEITEHVDALLKRFEVDRIIVGHTPGFGTIVPRYDGRVVAADSGIAAHYGGHLASVLIENGKAFTVQRGQRVALPTSYADLLAYYRAIDEIEPDVNNLQYRIRQLERASEMHLNE